MQRFNVCSEQIQRVDEQFADDPEQAEHIKSQLRAMQAPVQTQQYVWRALRSQWKPSLESIGIGLELFANGGDCRQYAIKFVQATIRSCWTRMRPLRRFQRDDHSAGQTGQHGARDLLGCRVGSNTQVVAAHPHQPRRALHRETD